MLSRDLRVLLVEDNPGDARLIQEYLRDAEGGFRLVRVEALARGIEQLQASPVDVVLLDLSLPDSQGLETFETLHRFFPMVPVVVLSGLADEEVAVAAVRAGAQDYLVKGQVDGHLIGRAVRYAIERQHLEDGRRFIAEASTTLARSLDYATTLQRVAELAVPVLGDRCVIDLLDVSGGIAAAAIAAPLATQIDELRSYRMSFPIPIENTRHPVARAIASREPAIYRDFTPDVLAEVTIGDEHFQAATRFGIISCMVVPLVARDRVLGSMSFFAIESKRFFETSDRDLAVDLAQHAALAIDNSQLYQQARDAIRVRDMVLSSVAHDLRAPLTPIKLIGETLRWQVEQGQQPENGALLEGLTSIDANVEKIASQIDELLDIARLQMGRAVRLQRRRADLLALVRGQLVEYQSRTRRHHLRLQTEADSVAAWLDVPRIERVLGNILSNAVKYSPDGGDVIVRVSTAADGSADWAIVDVTDGGVGISAADLPQLFNWFFRSERVAQDFPGTGIGLAGAARIVELHGGTISVRSEEGQGSTFTVRLPLGEPRYEEPES